MNYKEDKDKERRAIQGKRDRMWMETILPLWDIRIAKVDTNKSTYIIDEGDIRLFPRL